METQQGSYRNTTETQRGSCGEAMGIQWGPNGDPRHTLQGQSLHHPPPEMMPRRVHIISSQQTTRVDLFDLQLCSSQNRKRKGKHNAVEDYVHPTPGAERFLDVQLLCWFRERRSDDGYCEIKEKQRSGEKHFSAFGVAAVSF